MLNGGYKIAIVWLVVITLAFVGFEWYLHEQQRAKTRLITSPSGAGKLELDRGRDRHYRVLAKVNQTETRFMLDTGATVTAIPKDLSQKLNLPVFGSTQVMTANGKITVDIVRIDLEIPGLIKIDNLKVTVLAEMRDEGLLGMDVLGRLRMVQESGKLSLEKLTP